MAQAAGKVVHNTEASQFEMEVPGGLAVLQYVRTPQGMDLLHTKVPPEDEGAGHASALVRAALDHAREANERIVPSCAFVKAYLVRHPEDQDLALDP